LLLTVLLITFVVRVVVVIARERDETAPDA